MENYLVKLLEKLKLNLPLLIIILIALAISFQNIKPNTYYSGWDNIHAEFDLKRYAKQVFFGAWLEHQSLGAPAAQGHLSEIPRLPILFLLQIILPQKLIRYVFIFSMYLIGGIGTYLYLKNFWLQNKSKNIKKWLASIGGVFYLLHILTLQQFYISFEMFMVQFAFLPFLLISVHKLAKKTNTKHILIFILVQLLIAPSGHTSTVFYLGVLLSMIYGFFIKFEKNKFSKAIKLTLLIGFLSFITNAYWILPNLYYGFNNSQYVQQSRDNQLFGPESIWSVREAGSFNQLLTGTHYLFNWRDYSFENQEFGLIFNEWQDHLSKPTVSFILTTLGVITFSGLFITLYDKKIGYKKFAIILYYLFCLTFIWIDLFPTSNIFDNLYKSSSFLEAFRNPFTKLSILYSFVSIILFTQTLAFITSLLKRKNKKIIKLIIPTILIAIIYSAWPSFQGHFISEKLRIEYPQEYQQMFDYLKTKNKNLRILQLPQLTHAGWVLHDWSFIKTGNGYQGMGFVPFGIPQAVVNRDSDRWIETSDFFYHELKYALDTKNTDLFNNILKKYNIDLIIIDETKIDPARKHNYDQDHKLITQAGLVKIWEQNFLSIYQQNSFDQDLELIIPNSLSFVSGETDRIRTDYIYKNQGNYVLTDNQTTNTLYPFSDLSTKKLNDVIFTENKIEITRDIPKNNYTISVPGLSENRYLTPAVINYRGETVTIEFPIIKIELDSQIIQLPKLANFEFKVNKNHPSIILFFNRSGVIIEQGKTIYPVISLETNKVISVAYTPKSDQFNLTSDGEITSPQIIVNPTLYFNFSWDEFKKEINFPIDSSSKIKVISEFPTTLINLKSNPSVNCSNTYSGSITTEDLDEKIVYKADNYGVNCNSYDFRHISPAYSYILNISGQNKQGRGTKFFINYSDKEVLFEDYLMQASKYNSFLTLHKTSTDPKSRFYLNWETRSFGRTSINEINKIQIGPFPLSQISQLKLQKDESPNFLNNDLKVISHQSYLNFIHLVNFQCNEKKCYLGLDQSYDDLWLSFKTNKLKLLPHYRLNNWANLWEINSKEGKLVIFYLPELVSLSSLLFLSITIIILFTKIKKKQITSYKKSALKRKIKHQLRGK